MNSSTATVDAHAAAEQLMDEVDANLVDLGAFLGEDVEPLLKPRVEGAAHQVVARMLSDDPVDARLAAELVMDLMWPLGEPPTKWWSSDLGRAVARVGGATAAQREANAVRSTT